MATFTWRGLAPAAPATIQAAVQPWIEKYRAALLETDPQRQLERIAEAFGAMDHYQTGSRHDAFDRAAIEDARIVLHQLRDETLSRAQTGPWLL
ncbi:MAG TPA: hypothetical protein VFA89_14780 [Terriglobales bacterium]|nr:hypothetical protein [Terriglobales bacterium]